MYVYMCVCVVPVFVRSFLSLYEKPPTVAVPSDIANVILNIKKLTLILILQENIVFIIIIEILKLCITKTLVFNITL